MNKFALKENFSENLDPTQSFCIISTDIDDQSFIFLFAVFRPTRISTYFGPCWYHLSICLWPPSFENGSTPNSASEYLTHLRIAPRKPILRFSTLSEKYNEV